MKIKTIKFSIVFFAVLLSTVTLAKTDEEILRYADISRGGGLPGLEWEVSVASQLKRDRTEHFKLKVSATSGDWLAEFKQPRNVLGNKLLQIGDNMWFTKKGLRKAVPISQRQRLTGSAANGDIASTNYVSDYAATRLSNEPVDSKLTYVFDLKANSASITYDRIKYWVDQETGLGVKAEFYTSAGRLLKSATFEYGNIIMVNGDQRSFISRMVIQDEINQSQRSVLEYSNIKVKPIPAARFRL